MDDAGLHTAEDQKNALREAESEEAKGHIKLHRLKTRKYLVQNLELPLSSEPWLLGLFNRRLPAESMTASLLEVSKAEGTAHERFPKLWTEWCRYIKETFRSGKNLRPLYWRAPDNVRCMLVLIHRLTSLEWREGALIREVSIEIGLNSKGLERQRRGVEACLKQMFGRPMSLQSLGIVLTDSRADISGILTLHYDDGRVQVIEELKAVYSISLDDLMRATHATTPAKRLLTIENSKTTLRRIATSNNDGSSLLAACSFPTTALLRLIELLPSSVQVFHFGDTDPAGFDILSKLRQGARRRVLPFLMERRNIALKRELGEYDQAVLPRLLGDPMLRDVVEHIRAISESACKGDFEQETIGLPDLGSWPFFSSAMETATGVSSRRDD